MGLESNGGNGGGNKTFLTINGGKIKQASTEGTPGVEKREWEKDGKSGVKWEIPHDSLSGHIVGLNFKDGDFGTSLIVDLQDDSGIYSLQITTKSRYFDDIAKKLKSINLGEVVKLTPFDFESKTDKDSKGDPKKIVGISVNQNGEKITSYYYDGKKSINKMPKVDEKEKEEMGKDYWTIYFVKVGNFLKKEIEGVNVPEPKVIEKSSDTDIDDLPFG